MLIGRCGSDVEKARYVGALVPIQSPSSLVVTTLWHCDLFRARRALVNRVDPAESSSSLTLRLTTFALFRAPCSPCYSISSGSCRGQRFSKRPSRGRNLYTYGMRRRSGNFAGHAATLMDANCVELLSWKSHCLERGTCCKRGIFQINVRLSVGFNSDSKAIFWRCYRAFRVVQRHDFVNWHSPISFCFSFCGFLQRQIWPT